MPTKAPRICSCGRRVPSGVRCECQKKRDAERKARHDQNRPNARARGYDRQWEIERQIFLRLHPYCARCGDQATVIHHRIPHKGDKAIFWAKSNWVPVCKPCHDGPLQSEERKSQ